MAFPGAARPLSAALARAAAASPASGLGAAGGPGPEAAAPDGEVEGGSEPVVDPGPLWKESWRSILQLGFSLALEGVGSKRQLLEAFADAVLVPWGAAVVHMEGYDARFLLPDCLRDVLDALFPGAPRAGTSIEALVAALRAAQLAAGESQRPLCLLVHNLECLPVGHQAALAGLAATRGVHLVASVDNIWAPLSFSPKVLKDFNFCWEVAHTFRGYEVEVAGRFPGGLPAWADPLARRGKAEKASLGLVLRTLTHSHRELVQAIAEHQLESGGRAGISQSRLLAVAADRMIANTAPKLRSLLNELKDHEVIAMRGAADGGALLYLTCTTKALERLAEGKEPEDSEEGESEGDGAEPA